MNIALVSLNQAWENKDINIQACREFIQSAKVKNAELVIFPEMTLTSFSMNTKITAEEKARSETAALFRKLAMEFQIAIIFGVVFRDGSKATNNALMIDNGGIVRCEYSKIHPFSFAGEDEFFNGGNRISYGKLDQMTLGLTICYDLRFPELYSALAKHCNIIINIANWPAKRVDHWNILLKARAIENQCLIVGVNRVGKDGSGLEYIKSTQIINPDGELMKPCYSENELDIFEIDTGDIDQFKKSFSTVQDRKIDFYKSIL